MFPSNHNHNHLQHSNPPYDSADDVDADDHDTDDSASFFRTLHGRSFNTLNTRYLLPADQDELKRYKLHHRMMQFVFSGKNYVGPVAEVLHGGHQRRVLDLGTGDGSWAIDLADEFPKVEVIGVDLAPIQPRSVPPNCTFELCDLDQWNLPYPDNYFDLIHARSMHTGISNYPRLIHEISRLLKPGGLVIVIEPDLMPIVDGKPANEFSSGATSVTKTSQSTTLPDTPSSSSASSSSSLTKVSSSSSPGSDSIPKSPSSHHPTPSYYDEGLPGWFALFDTYRACLKRQGVDTTAPSRIPELLSKTKAFHHIVVQDGNIPIGFWPSGVSS
ncbi:hypothetical protein ONZ45_g19147 [Pleurotus djamor]|nr:hypothetical protein ONZ45_g19147 [Pleurotus djamor]